MPRRRSNRSGLYKVNSPSDYESAASVYDGHSRRKTSRLPWVSVILSGLVLVMIGIFSIVFYIHQQKLDNQRLGHDQQMTNWTLQQAQQQADDLFYRDTLKAYIDEMSNVLFKAELSEQAFVDSAARRSYIRSKTLRALEELDWQRRTRVFLYLYEQKLLPRSSINQSLSLSSACLVNIRVQSSLVAYQFRSLSLPLVDLTNASLIQCYFWQGANFTGSVMTDVKLTGSRFGCSQNYDIGNGSLGWAHVRFDGAQLQYANFVGSLACDVSFSSANLMYANFSQATFWGRINMIGTNLVYTDFTNTLFFSPAVVNIVNANLTGARLVGDQLQRVKDRGDFRLTNVILPNGTWLVNGSNLVMNGNADANVSSSVSFPRSTSSLSSASFHQHPDG